MTIKIWGVGHCVYDMSNYNRNVMLTTMTTMATMTPESSRAYCGAAENVRSAIEDITRQAVLTSLRILFRAESYFVGGLLWGPFFGLFFDLMFDLIFDLIFDHIFDPGYEPNP